MKKTFNKSLTKFLMLSLSGWLLGSVALAESGQAVMHFNVNQIRAHYLSSLKNYNNNFEEAFVMSDEDIAPQKYDLRQYMHKIDGTWNQGSCGSCWVWGATLASEIAYSKYINQPTRFSVQEFMSNYCNGGHDNILGYSLCSFACNGGFVLWYADYYNQTKKFIPWENEGASEYKDVNGGMTCQDNAGNQYQCSNVLPAEITTDPYVAFKGVTPSVLNVWDQTEEVAITSIKKELLAGNAVLFAVYFPTDENLNSFRSFWKKDTEDTIYDFSSYDGKTFEGKFDEVSGHELVIIGFDDTDPDPANHYWEVQNSWGVSDKRPNGVFRMKMHINYNMRMKNTNDDFSYPVMYFELLKYDFDTPTSVVYGKVKGVDKASVSKTLVWLNDNEHVFTSVNGTYLFTDVPRFSDVKLNFKKQGFKFNPETYSGKANQEVLEVNTEASLDEAYANCKVIEVNKTSFNNRILKLIKIDEILQAKLKSLSLKVKSDSKKAILKALLEKYEIKSYESINKIKSEMLHVPSIIYHCENCSPTYFRNQTKKMRQALVQYYKTIKTSAEFLIKYKPNQSKFVNNQLKSLDEIFREAKELIKNMPTRNDICK